MKLFVLAIMLSLLAPGSAFAQTVILVRHAEKADDGADPPLSALGQARAHALAKVAADAGLDHVFTSTLQRTFITADSVAKHHSVTVNRVSLDAGAAAHVADLTAKIRALPSDAVVLMVGHSNTVPLIARALGFAGATDMADCEYDRLTLLDMNNGRTRAVVGRYGAPSVCG